MAIHLQPNMHLPEPQAVKQLRVPLWCLDRPLPDIPPELLAELLPRHRMRHPVRWVVSVRRHLHRELATRGHHRRHPREHLLVPVKPLQRRVREHNIERPLGLVFPDFPLLEPQAVARELSALLQHRL